MALLYAKASNGYLASIPVNVMGFTQSLALNGWQKLPSGLIIQWGTSNVSDASGNAVINYPISFNAIPFILLGTHITTNGGTISSNTWRTSDTLTATIGLLHIWDSTGVAYPNGGCMFVSFGK